jgi:pyoverdine/dityrosine biosynthesis protein Dit1
VDDKAVDIYSQQLQEMNDLVAADYGSLNRIHFRSLVELLRLQEIDQRNCALKMTLPTVTHPISTKVHSDAELCRQVLLKGFRPDSTVLRSRISANEPAVLALYRGFSKFMLEDLDNNPYTAKMSKSQRRKLSSKIALEMIEVRRPHHNADAYN